MKLLKWALAAIAAVGAMLLLGGLVLPPSTRIERSVDIARAPGAVFVLLDATANHARWSPWLEADPQASVQYQGPPSGAGAVMAWQGNAMVGSGSHRITASRPPHQVDMTMDFGGKPFTSSFQVAATPGATRVSWSVVSQHGYNPLDRWFGVLLLEPMIGPDLERGLHKLRAAAEQPAAAD